MTSYLDRTHGVHGISMEGCDGGYLPGKIIRRDGRRLIAASCV
jgi:hypothetical protein